MTSLPALAPAFVRTAVDACRREYPCSAHHVQTSDDDRPTNRELHPAFYGCYDWHSAVHMHDALVRLLLEGVVVDTGAARRLLDEHLTTANLAREAGYVATHPGWERPYGWGWALALGDDLLTLAERGDEAAGRWAVNIIGLCDAIVAHLLTWLPKLDYPVRVGMHTNTAFGLWLALPWARRLAAGGDPTLLEALTTTSRRLYAGDRDYPVGWEPGGTDFLSGALTEAVLMASCAEDFPAWLDGFLPGFDLGPVATPAVVSDAADGQITHLHGLNLSRAWLLRELARVLGDDPRATRCREAAQANLAASLDAVTGGDWMAEHWLVSYAVGALRAG